MLNIAHQTHQLVNRAPYKTNKIITIDIDAKRINIAEELTVHTQKKLLINYCESTRYLPHGHEKVFHQNTLTLILQAVGRGKEMMNRDVSWLVTYHARSRVQ